MEIIIIAAVSKNGVIGDKGKMPWHSKDELAFFKDTTLGNPVLMGRKTFESLRASLEGRTNIIITKNHRLKFPQSCRTFFSIELAIEFCVNKSYDKCRSEEHTSELQSH